MISPSSLAFLKRLLDAPAPSGFETVAARVWRTEASTFADKVTTDVAGNSMAEVNPEGSPTIMLDGHIDEIGVIVQYIDDEGYLYISPIGGWDPQVLVGQRLRFLGNDGDVLGVVGKKPIHLMKNDDRERASKFTDLWVDIGATNRAEAEARVSVGDPGVLDSRTLDFPNDRIVSRSIDDRIGAFVVLEALRRYAEKPGAARVVAAATTQEEIAWHGGGAAISAHAINPKIALVVDVTFATDHPNIEKKEIGEHKLCSSCCARRPGSTISRTSCTPWGATLRRTPTRSTSRAREWRRDWSRSRTATCTRRTRWCRSSTSTTRRRSSPSSAGRSLPRRT